MHHWSSQHRLWWKDIIWIVNRYGIFEGGKGMVDRFSVERPIWGKGWSWGVRHDECLSVDHFEYRAEFIRRNRREETSEWRWCLFERTSNSARVNKCWVRKIEIDLGYICMQYEYAHGQMNICLCMDTELDVHILCIHMTQ